MVWCVISFTTLFFVSEGVKDYVSFKEQNPLVQVTTTNGIVQGLLDKTEDDIKFFSFMGVPFAQPPLGDLRFRAPKPVAKWAGVLDARTSASCCLGLDLRELTFFRFINVGDEDCLYLNIYTPMLPNSYNPQPLKPVMVWFHGGSFFAGCSHRLLYGPEYLIPNGVVLVTVNYRLSFFGYLSTEDDACPGNWGLLDQILALEWIQENINKFGGDPDKVTIFGQSAGATSANLLMLSPRAKGLFHGIIMESGGALCPWSMKIDSRNTAFDLGYAAGITTNSSKDLISQLRGMTSWQLTESQVPIILVNLALMLSHGLPFTPVVEKSTENGVLSENAYDAMENGHYTKVPVIIGTNTLETLYYDSVMKLVMNFKSLLDMMPSQFTRNIDSPKLKYQVGKKIRSHFVKSDSYATATAKELYQLSSSDMYTRSISKTAFLLAKYNPVYFYEFAFDGRLGLGALQYFSGMGDQRPVSGAGHAEEIAYLFKSNMTPPLDVLPQEDVLAIKKMTKLWTNFAKFGNPTPVQDPLLDNAIWPTVSVEEPPFVKNYIKLGKTFTPQYQNFAETDILFWEKIYQKYVQRPYPNY